ncbi:MAG: glycine zipper 2TM domain-containing protein [Gammaproteobacteria bacterium]|jgi:uncharacterized protein YcfJ
MMTRTKKIMLALGCQCLVTLSADAYQAAAFQDPFDYAVVDDVKMQTRIINVPVQREACWEEPVTRYQPPTLRQPYSYTSTIAGGIVGAVVGNQFGSGSGREWATIAGSALGASIGRDYNASRAYAPARSYATIEQRCRIVTDLHAEERPDGFLVTYTYNGRRYQTTTPHHPGDRIKVRVDVSPVAY